MAIRFKVASKKSLKNYDRYKYVCPACDNEISFVYSLPSKCSDCLSPIDDDVSKLLKDKDKRLLMHKKLDTDDE